MYAPFRPWASLFCVAFHLMNSTLFSIGMFPWVCLAQMPLFFERDWPRKWSLFAIKSKNKVKCTVDNNTKRQSISKNICWRRSITAMLIVYCSLQAALPYSHSLTPGYNTWTEGPYGYSWDMMIHSWNTVRTSVRVRENSNGQDYYLDSKSFAYTDRWSKHADMAHQFVKCIKERLIQDRKSNQQSPLKSGNVSIFLDVWCSLNGRFQQRIFDPNIDLLTAPWSPWQESGWVLPIISSLLPRRTEITELSKIIISNNNSSDVMFIADFPGFEVEHQVPEELKEVSLKVLQGEVVLHMQNSPEMVLQTGMKARIESGVRHVVRTRGVQESGTMYEFYNQTLVIEEAKITRNAFSLVTQMCMVFKKRFKNYERFIRNVVYSLIFEIRLYMQIKS